eukprot:TRINITY_DN2366_c0_g1_i2.p1 TRINITY_DN2366_c0_g1~~TRINITY_DN2366_c0_g1_i2.p1  ORF type:complete len:331 (+),score=79.53 TRINITY_DN2366_c0_g1_i2:61-993(+)
MDAIPKLATFFLQSSTSAFKALADQRRLKKPSKALKLATTVAVSAGFGYLLFRHVDISSLDGASIVARIADATEKRRKNAQSGGGLLLPLASLALSLDESAQSVKGGQLGAGSVKESITGLEFPRELKSSKLLGLGVRNKKLLGLKNLRIYAFGVYADAASLKDKLGAKYASSKLDSVALLKDVIKQDVVLTVRLVISYRGLKIGQVRSAFQESLGGKLKELGGSAEDKRALDNYTSFFKDEFQLHRGTVIDLTRGPGHTLHTTIDGREVGFVKNATVCRCVFELYLGQRPFDKHMRDSAMESLPQLLLL